MHIYIYSTIMYAYTYTYTVGTKTNCGPNRWNISNWRKDHSYHTMFQLLVLLVFARNKAFPLAIFTMSELFLKKIHDTQM